MLYAAQQSVPDNRRDNALRTCFTRRSERLDGGDSAAFSPAPACASLPWRPVQGTAGTGATRCPVKNTGQAGKHCPHLPTCRYPQCAGTRRKPFGRQLPAGSEAPLKPVRSRDRSLTPCLACEKRTG